MIFILIYFTIITRAFNFNEKKRSEAWYSEITNLPEIRWFPSKLKGGWGSIIKHLAKAFRDITSLARWLVTKIKKIPSRIYSINYFRQRTFPNESNPFSFLPGLKSESRIEEQSITGILEGASTFHIYNEGPLADAKHTNYKSFWTVRHLRLGRRSRRLRLALRWWLAL